MVLTLSTVRCCRYRTHRFTGCMVTVLAHYGLEGNLRVGRWVFHLPESAQGTLIAPKTIHFLFFLVVFSEGLFRRIIPINTQPVHIPGTTHFAFSNHRYVVFGMTCNHTRPTTGTCVQIDGQVKVVADGPIKLIPKVGIWRCHRDFVVVQRHMWHWIPLCVIFGIENFQGSFLDDIPSTH